MTLSVVMVTYNSADVVEGALKSITGLWGELFVGDGGSTDGTVEIVRKYGAKVYRLDPRLRGDDKKGRGDDKKERMTQKNLGERKQELVEKAKGDWILVLDADELVSEELYKEIKSLTHSPRRSHALRLRSGLPPSEVDNTAAYRIPYQNYVFGKPVYYGGEKYAKVRLFRRGYARISPEPLHEEVIVNKDKILDSRWSLPRTAIRGGDDKKMGGDDNRIGELKGVIHHHSYRTPWQLFSKFTRYAWVAAGMDPRVRGDDKEAIGNDAMLKQLFLYGPHMFWARFVKEKGYKDGWSGLVLALAFGYMEGLTYWFLFIRLGIKDFLLLVIILSLHYFLLGNTKFIVFEEMFSYGWLIKKGLILYRDIGAMYPPGAFYLLYLVYSIFGFTFSTFTGLVYALVVITDVVLFVIARSWFGSRIVAALTLLFYVMWHVMLDGKILWFETMLMPTLLLALYFFWKYIRENQNRSLIYSGLFFSVAILIKQPSVYPLIATIIFMLFHWQESMRKKIIRIGYLLVIPVVSAFGVVLIYLHQGLLGNLLYWLWDVPTSVYAGHDYYLLRPRGPDLYAILPVLLVFLIGLTFSLTRKFSTRLRFLVLWGIAVILFAYPRWGNFHLLPFLAVSSLIFGESIWYVINAHVTRWIRAIVLGILIGMTVFLSVRELKHFFVDVNPKITEYSPRHYALLAQRINETTKNGRVYSFENVHLVYFLIDDAPVVLPWFSVSPILEMMSGIQDRLTAQLSDGNVEYVVYFPYATNTLSEDRIIPEAFKRIIEKEYVLYKEELYPERFMIYKKQL